MLSESVRFAEDFPKKNCHIFSENLLRFSDSGNVVWFREMLAWDFMMILPARKMFTKCGATANRTDAPQLSCKLPLANSHENRVFFSWHYTTAAERCCCVSGADNPTLQCKSWYYSSGEVTLPSCNACTNLLLTAVQREAITALLCAATLYGCKISNKVLRLDSQCLL